MLAHTDVGLRLDRPVTNLFHGYVHVTLVLPLTPLFAARGDGKPP